MTQQAQQPTGNKGLIALTAAGIIAISAQIGVYLTDAEGDIRKPYKDVAGIWTVCKGITGKMVVPGKTYTAEECRALESAYIQGMVQKIGSCVKQPLSFDEWVAYGHFTYNIGAAGFCSSTLVKKLNQGDRVGACQQMGRWTYIKKNGISVNCRDPKNKCQGLPIRRDFEVNMCMNAVRAN